ncbi:MAG TPA: lysylphosphatidylglycerol synthase transmembrane domain-containing protein, partial [Candidatus Krumholzibacteriaceae bacterium]|nr:lysylphosphatidylglycerol synthase transmembrane domain-containing protein [Candidatus Krumholzibacteriaceae bacterium]
LMRALSVRVSIEKTYAFMWVSIFVDSLIPAESVSGEISRAYLMSKEPNAETGKVVVSLVIHRVIMVLITIATLLMGTLILFISGYALTTLVMYLIWLVTIVTAVFLALVLVLCMKEKWMEKLVDLLLRIAVRIFRGRWRIEELREKAIVELRHFYDGLAALEGNLKHFIGPVVLSFISWIFSILVSVLVFAALGFSVDWILMSIIVVVFSLTLMIKSVPIGVPAEVGLPELAMAILYVEMGNGLNPPITAVIASAVTILTRLVSFAFKFAVGFVATQWVGLKTIMEGLKLGQKDKV